jgi:hypothetical protein
MWQSQWMMVLYCAPISLCAGVDGMDDTTLRALTGGNAARVLGLKF